MVRVALPPPELAPAPLFLVLPAGTALVRIFDPTSHGATALQFRSFGPIHRFDHHRGGGHAGTPSQDPERAIYYAALTLSSCLVEIFGDTRIVRTERRYIARPHTTRDHRLLDLRGPGAMKAGSVAALTKVADPPLSQAWSRFFYEHPETYSDIDGLMYFNAHNDEESLALYVRAADALICSHDAIIRLDDEALRPAILATAADNNLLVSPR